MRRDPSDELPVTLFVNDTFSWWVIGLGASSFACIVVSALLPWGLPLWLLLWFGFVVPAVPEALLRWAGAWRVAAFVAWMGNIRWYRTRGSAWPAFAALAALRDPTLWPGFDRQLRDVRSLAPGHLFGMALQAWAKGRPTEARDLMWLVLYIDTKFRPRPLIRWATEWLVCDALTRGQVDEAEALRAHPRVAWTLRCSLAVASQRGGQGLGASIAWVLSPPWGRTRSLLAAARGPVAVPVAPPDDPVRALAFAEASGHPDAVRHAVAVWGERLDDLPREVTARVAELGGVTGGPLGVVDEVEQVLVALVKTHRVSLAPDEAVRVRGRVLADLREEAGQLANELQRRTSAKEPVPIPEEVVAWCRVLRACEDVVSIGGPAHASHAFGLVHPALNNHAVWLHNRRGNQIVANAMYRRAWHVAEAAEHPAMELLYNNVDCGPGDGWPRRYD